MQRYLARRLMALPVLLLGISIVSFTLLNLAPGDPAYIILKHEQGGEEPSPESVRELRDRWHLDDPLVMRYGRWLTQVVRGDLGRSYSGGQPIMKELWQRLPATLLLAGSALLLAIIVGVPMGIGAALRRGSITDGLSRLLALVGAAVPSFALALLLMLVIGVKLNWLPTIGYGSPKHLILPTIALAAGSSAQLMRLTRASMLEVLQQDYVRTARAKGLSERVVIVSVSRTVPNQIAPVTPVQLGENVNHRTSGAVLRVGKRALFKISGGVTGLRRIVVGPPMSDRDRFRYAAIAFQVQKHSGISASWPQYITR
jgi:peptide/nickel transport system permease protein